MAKPTTSHQPKFTPLSIGHTACTMQHKAIGMRHTFTPAPEPSLPMYQARASTIPTTVPSQIQHHLSPQPYWQFELEAPYFGSTELTLANQNHQSSKNHTGKTYQLLVLPNHYHTLAFASLRATEFSK